MAQQSPSRTLVISDGSLASLVAAASARESIVSAGGDERAARPVLLFVPAGDETTHARRGAVERHASLYDLEIVDATADLRGPGAHGSFAAGLAETLTLINATYLGASKGCDLIVWPVQFAGPLDVDRVARVVDRALLVTRLASLDSVDLGRPTLRVDTPYADLTDRQLADLALDMNVPIESLWWWKLGSKSELAGAEMERWVPALQSLGWSPGREATSAR